MPVPTSAQLAQLRERPQSTRLYLSIYEPQTVWAAQVNGTVSGSYSDWVYFDTVSSTGTWASIVPGMTMLVGTYAGALDKGRIRVKEAFIDCIQVAQNSDIDWADDDFLTVIAFHEVWSKYASISMILDADDDIIILKDGDIAYTDQNNVMGSLVVMGGNYAGFVEDPVFYSASGTYNVLGKANTFAWTFEGGTPATSAVAEPGYVTYATPGHYTTTLKITDSDANLTDTAYRHVSIYDRFANKPIQQWGLSSFNGSRTGGGYQVSVWCKDDIPNLLEGSLVTIFSESIYGNTETDIGGNSANRSSVVFSGYIVEGSISYDYETSTINFNVASTTEVMRNRGGMSISADSVANPTKWQQLPDLDMRKAIYHYLKWHSTVTEVSDIKYIGYDHPVQYLETDMESLYDGLQSYIENRLDGVVVADRQNTIFIEPGIRLRHTAYPTNMSIDKQDWMGKPDIEFRATPPVSYVDLGGFSFVGSTGTSTALLAEAPGGLKSYFGDAQSGPQGLVLLTQAELNTMTGDYYAYQNARYPNVSMNMISAFPNMDIAPYEQFLLNIAAADTNRGIIFSNKPFHITEISWEYDPEQMSLLPDVTFHEITTGFDGVTVPVVIPTYVYTPAEIWEGDPFDWSSIVLPEFGLPPTMGRFGWSIMFSNVITGSYGGIQVPYNCMIDSAILVAKPSAPTGSFVVDLWRCSYADIIAGVHPVVADSICGTAHPTLAAAQKSATDVSSWYTQLYAGDWIFFNIDSINACPFVTLAISGTT